MLLAQTAEYPTRLGRHALVIGGSLAGLLATRVLAESFEKITCIERDTLTEAATHRKGVPQSRHAHGLLASGFGAMQRLFPDFAAEILAGALLGDLVGDFRWHQYGVFKAQFASGLRGIVCSRPLLESAVRRRVVRYPTCRCSRNVPCSVYLPVRTEAAYRRAPEARRRRKSRRDACRLRGGCQRPRLEIAGLARSPGVR